MANEERKLEDRIDQLAIARGLMGPEGFAKELGIPFSKKDRWPLTVVAAMVEPRVLSSSVGLMVLDEEGRRIMKEIVSSADSYVAICGTRMPTDRYSAIDRIYYDLDPQTIREMHRLGEK